MGHMLQNAHPVPTLDYLLSVYPILYSKSRSKRDITNNFSALYSLELCWMRWLVTHFTVAGNSGH